jgi:hypothetical protein
MSYGPVHGTPFGPQEPASSPANATKRMLWRAGRWRPFGQGQHMATPLACRWRGEQRIGSQSADGGHSGPPPPASPCPALGHAQTLRPGGLRERFPTCRSRLDACIADEVSSSR